MKGDQKIPFRGQADQIVSWVLHQWLLRILKSHHCLVGFCRNGHVFLHVNFMETLFPSCLVDSVDLLMIDVQQNVV